MKNDTQKNNTHFKSVLVVITFAVSTVAMPVLALDDVSDFNHSVYTKAFIALDTDSSHSLSKAEAQKDKLFLKHFSEADKNHDASLDEQEYTDFKSKDDQKNVKRIANDSLITSKVKANLLKEEGLKSLSVSVTTYKGEVLLSGFVETEDQIKQAGKVAADIEGVKSVKNSVLLKK